MKAVTLYTTPFCGYCLAAKRLLRDKGVSFEEIDVATDPSRRPEMIQRASGQRRVPQILVGDRHIGGFDEMYALDWAGKLDPLLADG